MMLLGNLAKQRKLNISPHVIAWLAERIPGSARQLIAVLSRLQTRTMETGRPLELAEVIELYQGEVCVSVDLETICRHVGTTFGVKMKELRGRDRQPRVLWPRQLSMYLARRLTGFSLAQIGAYFQRDHTTVRHACLKIEDALEDDAELPGLLRRLQAEIE